MCVTKLNRNCRCQFPTQTYNKKTLNTFYALREVQQHHLDTINTGCIKSSKSSEALGEPRPRQGWFWFWFCFIMSNVHTRTTRTRSRSCGTETYGAPCFIIRNKIIIIIIIMSSDYFWTNNHSHEASRGEVPFQSRGSSLDSHADLWPLLRGLMENQNFTSEIKKRITLFISSADINHLTAMRSEEERQVRFCPLREKRPNARHKSEWKAGRGLQLSAPQRFIRAFLLLSYSTPRMWASASRILTTSPVKPPVKLVKNLCFLCTSQLFLFVFFNLKLESSSLNCWCLKSKQETFHFYLITFTSSPKPNP